MLITHDHPLFRDFKHHAVHVDTILSFPVGTGGHFLCAQITGRGQLLPDVNEWLVDDAAFLLVDNRARIPYDDLDLDEIYRSVRNQRPMTAQGPVALCHNLPYLSHRIYDLRAHEMITLEVCPEHMWLPATLARIKVMLNSNWSMKPWLIGSLLDHSGFDHPVIYHQYESMCTMLSGLIHNESMTHSMISWRWYMHACKRDIDVHDPDQFRIFAGDLLFYAVKQQMTRGSAISEDDVRGPDYAQALLYLKAQLPLITVVDYWDLYMNKRRPYQGRLAKINPDEIQAYMLANMHLLSSAAALAPDDIRDYISTQANRIGQLLAHS